MMPARIDTLDGDFVAPYVLKDKRRTPRRVANMPVEGILLDLPTQPHVPLRCRDLTGRGMGFTSAYGFHVGGRLVVRFRLRTGQYDLVLCEVKHTNAGAGAEQITGVEFLQAVHLSGEQVVIPEGWRAGAEA